MGKTRRHRSSSPSGGFWRQEYGGAPMWFLALAVLAIAVFGAIGVNAMLSQPTPEARPLQPAPTFTFGSEEPDPIVAFIGDSYTGGSAEDSGESYRWPALVTRSLDIRSVVAARGGSGYVAVGPSGESLAGAVPEVPADADLVVVFGSRNDGASQADIESAANAMFDALLIQSPDAKFLIVGPAWITSDPPANLLASNAALSAAAAAHGFDFVAATDSALLADRPDLIGVDGVHPNDAGHAALAEFMLPLVEQRLPVS